MQEFKYVIKDELGIHARPAGLLAKKVRGYECEVTITKEGKTVDASRLLAVMSLGVKKGDAILVSVENGEKEEAFENIKQFFCENL